MSSLQSLTEPVKDMSAQCAALERFMSERGTYDAQTRADIASRLRSMGELPVELIAPADVAEARSILRVASWLAAEPPAAASAEEISWEDFKGEIREQYDPRLRSKACRKAIEHALGVLESVGARRVADINVRTIARIVNTRDSRLSPNTIHALLRNISAIASHAVALGHLPVNPFRLRPIRTFVRPARRLDAKHLTKDELRRIFEVLALDVEQREGWAKWRARRLQALVVLLSWTGLRRSEALYLQVQDIDLEQHIVNLVPRTEYRLKTDKAAQPVILLKPVEDILRDWLTHREDAPPGCTRAPSPWLFPNINKGTPWVTGPPGGTALHRFKAVALRAGVEDANFKMIRRAVATHLEAAGAGPAMIQRVLRHSNQQTSELYYRKADIANMREAMKNFTY